MALFSKIVTAMLFVFLGAGPMPLIAATQCHEHAKASMCCAADCPMTTAMTKGQHHSRVNSSRCGCQVTPPTSALNANEQNVREFNDTLPSRDMSALLSLPIVILVEVGHIPPSPALGSRSQSTLCTFQI